MAKWVIKQRNDTSRELYFKDKDGNPINLTGATVFFTAKATVDSDNTDTSALIKKDVTSHAAPTEGMTLLQLTETDTDVAAGKYKFDIKLKTASGVETNYDTQDLIVESVITRRSS